MPKNVDDDSLPTKTEASPEPEMPKQIRMTQYYAYYEENGRFRSWKEGDVITDSGEIKLLVGRQAPYVAE